jgi:hypothetical protein
MKCELKRYSKFLKLVSEKNYKKHSEFRSDIIERKYTFKAKRGGLAEIVLCTSTVFSNGVETNGIDVVQKVLVLPEGKVRVRVLPKREEHVTRRVVQNGKVINKHSTVRHYSGVEINYQKFYPFPDDFEETLTELMKGSDVRIYEPLRTKLQEAGLLGSSYGMGDYPTELLEKNKDVIFAAIQKAEDKASV